MERAISRVGRLLSEEASQTLGRRGILQQGLFSGLFFSTSAPAHRAAPVPLFIDGARVESESTEHIPLLNPATQSLLGMVPVATADEVDTVVASSQRAFQDWRRVPVPTRARVMLRYQDIIRREMDSLAACITKEQGKTMDDARGDVFRGLEVVEAAAGIAPLLLGKYQEHVARGIDTYSMSQPLGVCASLVRVVLHQCSHIARSLTLARSHALVCLPDAVQLSRDVSSLARASGGGGGQLGRPQAIGKDTVDRNDAG